MVKEKNGNECYGDHEGRTGHALVFFYFPTNGSTNPDVFFSLKPSASQGESCLKISSYWGLLFWRCQGPKCKQTDESLTSYCFID